MVREISAGKSLISAYLAYAADNNGQLLAGLREETGVLDRDGKELKKFLAKRWVLRLAPYFNHAYPGNVVVNQMAMEYNKMLSHNKIQGLDACVYIASVAPSLGLNSTFVGGNYAPVLDETFGGDPTVNDAPNFGPFFATHLSQVEKPSQLLIFASARSKNANGEQFGSEHIFAPRTTGGLRWSDEFQEKQASAKFGNVHPRWNGKAVTAQLDGSVTLLSGEELKDMRRWAVQATTANDENWALEAQ